MKTVMRRGRILFRYRELIMSEIARDLTGRFSRSKIGGLWAVIHPLAYAVLLGFVFSVLFSQTSRGTAPRVNFTHYVMAGTLGWSLFTDVVLRTLTVFIDRAALMKKIPFPRLCLPVIAGGVAFANNLILLAAVLAVYAVIGHVPGFSLLWMPFLMGLNLCLAMGIGLMLGVLNVFLRDLGQLVPIVLQFLFWLTPVVYSPSLVPEAYRSYLRLNPLSPLINAYQQCLVFGQAPTFGGLKWVAVLGVLTLAGAWALYQRAASELVDAL